MHSPFLQLLSSSSASLISISTISFALQYYHWHLSSLFPSNFSNTLSLFAPFEISVKDVPNFPSTGLL
jgi:hypothetical protein